MGIDPVLSGVPETALWTLFHRTSEARHPRTVLPDPVGVALADRLDFPFAARFGRGFPHQAQTIALRSRCFDDEIRAFLADRPDATVVALGEGLETTFWRVDNGRVRWLSVDLPDSAALRTRLLPAEDRVRVHAGSALDGSWMDEVDPAHGVIITAQGLLMYLPPADAEALIVACAERFPGAWFVFDAVTPLVDRQLVVSAGGSSGYRPPPLRWFVAARDLPRLRTLSPAIRGVREVRSRSGRGVAGWVAARLRFVPVLGRQRPMVVRLTFGGDGR
ncbi:class I SAM-dependent methyltransferase [Hamadaea tsunoensis]|uniref:class I SAM-dependent methyltransferase n=1 Tax=Hamadaea tsunoensis TaxID=53368 RepID=UPI001B7F95C8|nr:class I SAM-dependent methyltransferase [Hamadaea tsunoensis]